MWLTGLKAPTNYLWQSINPMWLTGLKAPTNYPSWQSIGAAEEAADLNRCKWFTSPPGDLHVCWQSVLRLLMTQDSRLLYNLTQRY